jgi:hypothetical protein
MRIEDEERVARIEEVGFNVVAEMRWCGVLWVWCCGVCGRGCGVWVGVGGWCGVCGMVWRGVCSVVS